MTDHNYHNLRFLIVDNIKPSQDILKKFASTVTKKQVDCTHYAQDVISLCQLKPYDVIFLGYDLGDKQKNGQQILEELRVNNYVNRQCIIILVTAEVSQSMVLAALEHKPDHYLCKPYSLKDLDKRLKSCLKKKIIMASIYQALDDHEPDKIIKQCKKAIKENGPYKTECLGILSRQYFELKQYDKAKEIYSNYQDIPNCQWATIGLGKVALEEGNLHEAEVLFKLLISKYPLYLSSYDWLAVTYEAQLHHLFAEEILEQALQLSPRSLTRLQKYAGLCVQNEHFDKATAAYEKSYNLAHNSIHHCADNTLNYVQALIEYSPSLEIVDAKKLNTKAFSFMKEMIRDFDDVDLKVQSHLLAACLFKITQEIKLSEEEYARGEALLTQEQANIEQEKLNQISETLKKLKKEKLANKILTNHPDAQHSTSNVMVNEERMKEIIQAEIDESMALYGQKNYNEAIDKLGDAERSYPKHVGIKFNLLQILLMASIKEQNCADYLVSIDRIIATLKKFELSDTDKEKFLKMQKKYQLIAGI